MELLKECMTCATDDPIFDIRSLLGLQMKKVQ